MALGKRQLTEMDRHAVGLGQTAQGWPDIVISRRTAEEGEPSLKYGDSRTTFGKRPMGSSQAGRSRWAP